MNCIQFQAPSIMLQDDPFAGSYPPGVARPAPRAAAPTPAAAPAPRAATPYTTQPARAVWDDAVREARESGMSAAAAVSHVNRKNPGLRERMLAEVNRAAGRKV